MREGEVKRVGRRGTWLRDEVPGGSGREGCVGWVCLGQRGLGGHREAERGGWGPRVRKDGVLCRSPPRASTPVVSVPFFLTDGHSPVQPGQPVEPMVRLLCAVCGGNG